MIAPWMSTQTEPANILHVIDDSNSLRPQRKRLVFLRETKEKDNVTFYWDSQIVTNKIPESLIRFEEDIHLHRGGACMRLLRSEQHLQKASRGSRRSNINSHTFIRLMSK